MQFPIIDKSYFPALKLMHGFYNSCIMLLFFYQAWLGFLIRRARLSGKSLPLPLIRRHRKIGPIAAVFGITGFFLGISLVLLDTGRITEYPSHLIAGGILVVLMISAYVLSRNIKGPDSPFRKPHAAVGSSLLILYLIEVFLGIGVLF